jgi:GntR family transcriptional repressor for pyruvate dehydrogenase complex
MGATELHGSPHLAPIARPAVADEIVNRLIRLILDEQLKPGDRLPSEHELMAQLAVGRSSLREAIKTLRAMGVVDVVNGNGMFVGRGGASLGSRPLSWGLLMHGGGPHELIDARRLIESELAALAAQHASDEEIATIGELATARPSTDPEARSQTAIDFHLAVARAAHNVVLSYFLEGLQHILRDWISSTNVAHPEDALRNPDEHVPIFHAIRTRDAEDARAAMAVHLDAAGARLLRLLAERERAGDGATRSPRLAWAWPGGGSSADRLARRLTGG